MPTHRDRSQVPVIRRISYHYINATPQTVYPLYQKAQKSSYLFVDQSLFDFNKMYPQNTVRAEQMQPHLKITPGVINTDSVSTAPNEDQLPLLTPSLPDEKNDKHKESIEL